MKGFKQENKIQQWEGSCNREIKANWTFLRKEKNEGVKKNLVAYEGKYLEKHIKKPEYTT